MEKIIVTDEVISDVLATGKSVDNVLADKYAGEIADRVKSNEAYKTMSPIKMAMADAGLDASSRIKDFSTAGAGEWLLPAFIDTRLAESVAGNSMLEYVVNTTTPVDSLTVMSAALDLVNDEKNKEGVKKRRVGEGADIPLAKIKLGESAIRLYKRGRAVEATYEALQYMRVDLFAKTLDAIANDVADQQMADAIAVLVNGDGNDNAPEVVETAVAGVVDVDDILNAMVKFQSQAKMPITTIVAGENMFKQLFKMTYQTDTAFGVDGRFGMVTPQFAMNNVNVVLDTRVPQSSASKDQAILLNRDMALVKYVAVGSNIRELDKNIRNQTQLGTVSEIAAFAKFNKYASLLLRSK